MADIPVLLLAAGGSTRMGQPKQLLPWGKQTLIEYQVQTLLKIGNPVVVVLGANSSLVFPLIEKFDIHIVINNDWEMGMGTSISAGIHQIAEQFPFSDGVLITLLDQPLVTVAHLQNLCNQFQPKNRQIIVSQSGSGWKGVPALFDRQFFDKLKELKGEEGAKTIIQKHKKSIISVDCGNQLDDIDTPGKYNDIVRRVFQKPNK